MSGEELRAPAATDEVHEFTEDVADGSMCVCGVPAFYHEEVMSKRTTLADIAAGAHAEAKE